MLCDQITIINKIKYKYIFKKNNASPREAIGGPLICHLIRSTGIGGWDSLSLNPPPASRAIPTPAKRKQKPQAPGRSSGLVGCGPASGGDSGGHSFKCFRKRRWRPPCARPWSGDTEMVQIQVLPLDPGKVTAVQPGGDRIVVSAALRLSALSRAKAKRVSWQGTSQTGRNRPGSATTWVCEAHTGLHLHPTHSWENQERLRPG